MDEIEVSIKCTTVVALCCCFISLKLSFVVISDFILLFLNQNQYVCSLCQMFVLGTFVSRLPNYKTIKLKIQSGLTSSLVSGQT